MKGVFILLFLSIVLRTYSQQIGIGTGQIAPLELVMTNGLNSEYRIESKLNYFQSQSFTTISTCFTTGYVLYYKDSSIYAWSGISVPVVITYDKRQSQFIDRIYSIDLFFDFLPANIEYKPKDLPITFFGGIRLRYFRFFAPFGGIKWVL